MALVELAPPGAAPQSGAAPQVVTPEGARVIRDGELEQAVAVHVAYRGRGMARAGQTHRRALDLPAAAVEDVELRVFRADYDFEAAVAVNVRDARGGIIKAAVRLHRPSRDRRAAAVPGVQYRVARADDDV